MIQKIYLFLALVAMCSAKPHLLFNFVEGNMRTISVKLF